MKSVVIQFGECFEQERWGIPATLDFSSLSGTRRYCDDSSRQQISAALQAVPLRAVHWTDTGDYHYATQLFLERLQQKTQLLLIDNHPDNQSPAFGEILSCGGWRALSARLPFVEDDCWLGHEPWHPRPDLPLYLSIDLDALSPQVFRTNWNQGEMTLEELFSTLDSVLEGRTLAGVDICGGICAEDGGTQADFSANARVRNSIKEYFEYLP